MDLVITGGAGYIGSHVALEAVERGHNVTIFDNLSSGAEENIHPKAKFLRGSVTSCKDLKLLFSKSKFNGVIHLAGLKASGESMLNPIKYAENNILGGINLLSYCLKNKINKIVFSSSASIYGDPTSIPLDENHLPSPINYYGFTKLCIEDNLKWFSLIKGIRYVTLRYFNAAGYDIYNRIKGLENNPQNLIPKAMEVAIGKRDQIEIYGNDYKTEDGTGIRDYIHVSDLAKAHLDSIELINKLNQNFTINLGSGKGSSVMEILNKIEIISNKSIKYQNVGRRSGDSTKIIADIKKAKKILNWEPRCSDLDTIISTTWNAYKQNNSISKSS